MKLIQRKFQTENDYWKIRQFLREVHLANNRQEISWPLYRWDYWRWHVNENIFKFNLNAAVFMWELPDGTLVGVVHPDGKGEAVLQVRPHFHTPELDVEMLSIAETQFATNQTDGRQQLETWVHEADKIRQDILTRRGYKKQNFQEYHRYRSLDIPAPDYSMPDGYTLRALGDSEEHPARSWVSWKAFHPNEPDEKYQGSEWYRNIQRAPLYRRDLDLIAVAPTGEHAAFCTLWFDDVTRTASFEPVGTHPAHQRKGLGKALMAEGLSRVSELGATLCTVNSYSEAAGALYASLGFSEYYLTEPWMKEW